jgi:hypothetical protein
LLQSRGPDTSLRDEPAEIAMSKPASSKASSPAPHKVGHAALSKHAGTKDTIEFKEEIRVGTLRFFKFVVAKFEDPAMAAYFDVAFNGTEFTTSKPNVTIGADEINFDPDAPGQTVDPHTVIGRGRAGIEPGTTIYQHLTGKPGTGNAALEPHDSAAAAAAEG